MLKLFHSSCLQPLADTLLGELQSEPPENPLVPEVFVVQNYGMARWLSLFIARREGIAANLEFKFSAEIYWQILREIDKQIPEDLPSDRIPMSWSIFEILQNSNDSGLAKLQQYVNHEDPKKQEMRCWHLACRIADVFDQYLTYRPAMLRKWEKGQLSMGFDAGEWQQHLWRKLSERWKKQGRKEGVHRATLEKELVDRIDNENISKDKLPPRILVFGVSEMPETYIKTLVKVSELIDVHFYSVDVSQNKENPFIHSLGKAGIDFHFLIQKHIRKDSDIKDVEISDIPSSRNDPQNFFQQVKRDLVNGSQPDQMVQADRSVQIHSCHSPRREVEVLYDQLLLMLDENEGLDPSDILVMCPNMEEYGPEIEAIFGAVESDIPEIPYHLAERADETNIIHLTFRKLLQVVDSRFKVTDLLDLLDCRPIRSRFSMTEDEVNTLEKWIEDNNIRWGISGKHKQSLNLPQTDSFTWRSGLNRMMAGYAMQTLDDALFQSIYPYDEIQQTEHAELLGRFSHFINMLFEAYREVENVRSLNEWCDFFSEWLLSFFPDDEAYYRDIQKLRDIVHSLREQSQLSGMHATVSYRIVRSYLEDRLDQTGTGGGRPGQGVTFSGMIAMRNIPARVVCMIGMNDGVFPRRKDLVEFNLITKDPEPGDRLPGREDRQIFLENILACDNKIYFSYTGQSNKKEINYPPSVVLREFVDYLIDSYKIDEEEIIQQHKLQSFSPLYFKKDKDNKLISYSVQNRNIADALQNMFTTNSVFFETKLPEPDVSLKKLSVNEFVSFFQHPAKFLFRNRLGIFFKDERVLDEDREIFELGGLDRYSLAQEMLERYIDEQSSLQSFKDVAFARDLLPEGWPGEQSFNMQARKVYEFGQEIEGVLQQEQLEPVEIDFTWNDIQVFGKLDQIYEKEQVLYRLGKRRPKDIIELWIKHLLFQTAKPADHPGRSTLFTFDKKSGVDYLQLPALKEERILADLLMLYWRGLSQPLYFFPQSSFTYAEQVLQKGSDESYALEKADKKWYSPWSTVNEREDPYFKKILGGRNPLFNNELGDQFKHYSKVFWAPFFAAVNQAKEGGT